MSASPKRGLGCIGAIIILALCIAVAAIIVKNKKPVETEEQQERVWAVDAVTVTPQRLAPILDLYGTVTTSSQATLTSALAADVTSVAVKAGDHVLTGQALIKLDEAEVKIAQLQAQAQYHEASAALSQEKTSQQTEKAALAQEQSVFKRASESLQRARDLHRRGLASQADLDNAEDAASRAEQSFNARQLAVEQQSARLKARRANLASADAALQRATIDLKRAEVRAPFNAYIVEVHVASGDRVSPGQAMLTLYNADDVEIRAQIPNRYLAAVRAATDSAKHQSTALPHLQLKADVMVGSDAVTQARLVRLAHTTRASSGGVDAWLALDNNVLELGRHVRLRLALPIVDGAIAVQAETIYGLDHLFKIDNEDRLRKVNITVLGTWYTAENQQMILVKPDGLVANDRVLRIQLPNAAEGLLVKATGEAQ